MHLWCIQCNERPITVTTYVKVSRGRLVTGWVIEVCYPCYQVLECMLDSGSSSHRRQPAGNQLRMEVAART